VKIRLFGRKVSGQAGPEDAKRRLSYLRLQKEIVSDALLKVYSMQELDPEIRETLIQKYKNELREINREMYELSSAAELQDLIELREELVRTINEKIQAIDRRIEELRKEIQGRASREERKAEMQQEGEDEDIDELYRKVNSILEKLEKIDA
jgi:gas vesicle protein